MSDFNWNDITAVSFGGTTLTQINYNGSKVWPASIAVALTIAANTNNYNIQSQITSFDASAVYDVTLTINNSITVGSTSTANPPAPAMFTNTGWGAGSKVTVINNGTIMGKGGVVGSTPSAKPSGPKGTTGGTGGDGGLGVAGCTNGENGGSGSAGSDGQDGDTGGAGGAGGVGFANQGGANLEVDFTTAGTVEGGAAGSHGAGGAGGPGGLGAGGGGGGGGSCVGAPSGVGPGAGAGGGGGRGEGTNTTRADGEVTTSSHCNPGKGGDGGVFGVGRAENSALDGGNGSGANGGGFTNACGGTGGTGGSKGTSGNAGETGGTFNFTLLAGDRYTGDVGGLT